VAEKTHDPTPKRLRDARAKGDVPSAPLVAGAVGLLASVPLARGAVHDLAVRVADSVQNLRPVDSIEPWSFARAVLAPTLPFAAVLGAVAVVSGVVQGSVTLSVQKLTPDASRLDPFGGLSRLVDTSRAWSALRGTLVAVALSGLLGRLVLEAAARGAWALHANGAVTASAELASRIVYTAGALACLVAAIDAVVARRLWLGRLRMSRDEVVREHKEGDGDPEVKRRREELHHELMAAEALTAVKEATVVVINPTHLACALKYDATGGEDVAPMLTAKGHGALAARMIEAARAAGVPVIRDVPVARAVHQLELGTEIPEALYEAVAEVLRAAWDGEGL
jgi:flagellar biosynthesis protein FlhB